MTVTRYFLIVFVTKRSANSRIDTQNNLTLSIKQRITINYILILQPFKVRKKSYFLMTVLRFTIICSNIDTECEKTSNKCIKEFSI